LLDGLVPAEEALPVILFECLTHTAANVPAVLESHDSDGLHQFRVGLRRLRSALSVFGKELPEMRVLNDRAKAISCAAGPARDFDVFLDELFEPALGHLGHQSGFEILRSRAKRSRERAWLAAIDEINSAEFLAFQDDVAAVASAKLWAGNGKQPLSIAAPRVMNDLFHRAIKRGKRLKQKAPADRHRLRITLKKLRYTSEFFAPLYRAKAVGHFLEPLKELQDRLGHLNDVAHVRGTLGRLMMEEAGEASLQAELSHASGLIIGWHQARAHHALQKTSKRWKAFKKAKVFWD
jgi:CHAD domain-containing protein